MKIEQQNQILGCMNDVLNQNGFRAEIMQKDTHRPFCAARRCVRERLPRTL